MRTPKAPGLRGKFEMMSGIFEKLKFFKVLIITYIIVYKSPICKFK